jgi:transposase
MDKQSLTLLLGQGLSVEKIAKRFGKHPSTIAYWMKRYGLEAPNREKHAAKGGIEREVLEELVAMGMSIGKIAETLSRSSATVRHWLRRYGLKTKSARQTRLEDIVRPAKAAGRLDVTMTCPHHGETEFFLERRGYYRCKRCRSDAVARRRRKMKATLVADAGGRCRLCGYDRCQAALEFHHVDPSEKRMPLSADGVAYALRTLREEASKCVLLCANCHAEVENGAATVTLE